jgi:hypothetical protein
MNIKKAILVSVGIRFLIAATCLTFFCIKFLSGDEKKDQQSPRTQEARELLKAVEKNEFPRVLSLLVRGIPTTAQMDDGNTPLHIAGQISRDDGGYQIVKELLFYGADVNALNHYLETPVQQVLYIRDIPKRMELINYFLLHGSPLTNEDIQGQTILEKTISLANRDGVGALLERWGFLFEGTQIEKAARFAGQTAGKGLGYTDMYRDIDIMKDKIKKERDALRTNIFDSIIARDNRSFKKIVETDPEAINRREPSEWGFTPLMVALLCNQREMVESLLNHKANVNATDKRGRTALNIVVGSDLPLARKNEYAVVLLEKKADITVRDQLDRTPISIAKLLGLEELVGIMMGTTPKN